MKKIILTLMCMLTGVIIIPLYAQHSDTLHPVDDVWIKTFGGGEGKNTFLKFDISSIPVNAAATNVTLQVYIAIKALNWDGDVKFMNVHSQSWVETDLEQTLWNFLRTDTVQQLLGFGTTTGWASSVDIKQIFNEDFIQGNIFCTIMLKDPDDPTMAPMNGTSAHDSNDSLMSGNIFNDYIIYPPHEFISQQFIPKLTINYVLLPYITSQPAAASVCFGDSATMSITATGDGVLSYQWQRNGSDIGGATLNTITINPATSAESGNYTCIVTNAFGTDTSDVAVLSVNPEIIADAGNPQTICFGNCVILGGSPTASGGTPPYSYQWVPAAALNDSSLPNPTACPSTTTTFCITITDVAGCTATDCVTITVDPEITVTFSTTDPSFCGGCDGTITANVSGGTPGYSYIWSNMETGQTATLLCAGSYCVTVTDFYGCTESA
ncbi:MAG: immunoglobulin domain-containing protein [Bacteroidota bacterium]